MSDFLLGIYFVFAAISAPCKKCQAQEGGEPISCPKYKINILSKLPPSIKEASGLCTWNNSLLTLSDGGNAPKVYAFDLSNTDSVNAIPVSSFVQNFDWETVTSDTKNNLYIGDVGNNMNIRPSLRIFKLDSTAKYAGTIEYRYPDQFNLPPNKDSMNFDCEASFWYNNELFLVSKNRGKGTVKLYSVPDSVGTYFAKIRSEITPGVMITGAAYHAQSQKLALLSYGVVILYDLKDENGTITLTPIQCKRFVNAGQSESIVFLAENELLIGNENGTLFKMGLK